MSPLLAGGLIGFGQGIQQVSKEFTAERLEGLRQDNQNKRQAALIEAANMRHAGSIAATRAEGEATRGLSLTLANQADQRIREEGGETRSLSRELAAQSDTRVREEGAAGRVLQLQLAELNEAGATRRHGQSMGIQSAQLKATMEQVSLVPQADGTMMRVKKDGTVLGPAMFDGKPLQGPKDVAASAKVLIDGNAKIISGLMDAHSKSYTDKEKADIMERITGLQEENKRLAGLHQRSPAQRVVDPAGRRPLSSFAGAPAPGTVSDGYKFKGGDPNDRTNWEATRSPLSSDSGNSGGTTPDDPLQIRDPFKSAGGILGSRVPELVTPTAPESPKARSQQAREQMVAEQVEREKVRAADTFRSIVEVGRFVPEDQWLIELALRTGKLNAGEAKTARQMLDQLRR